MSLTIPPFFETDTYFIDEKVTMFQFENEYKVYNGTGQSIGAVKQRLTFGAKLLRMVLNKSMLPFHLDIVDTNNQTIASINRGWTLFMSKMTVADTNGNRIGTIQQKFKLFKPTFRISDSTGVHAAEISGDWKAWNFTIADADGRQIGTISKKWGGAMKELFTTADKYNVSIDPAYIESEKKVAIVATAISIDMVMKENNN